MQRSIKDGGARVWAHSWPGVMVTNNAALNHWRFAFTGLSCPAQVFTGGTKHEVTDVPTRARTHAPRYLTKVTPCIYLTLATVFSLSSAWGTRGSEVTTELPLFAPQRVTFCMSSWENAWFCDGEWREGRLGHADSLQAVNARETGRGFWVFSSDSCPVTCQSALLYFGCKVLETKHFGCTNAAVASESQHLWRLCASRFCKHVKLVLLYCYRHRRARCSNTEKV